MLSLIDSFKQLRDDIKTWVTNNLNNKIGNTNDIFWGGGTVTGAINKFRNDIHNYYYIGKTATCKPQNTVQLFSKTFTENTLVLLNCECIAQNLPINKNIIFAILIKGSDQDLTLTRYVHNSVSWEAEIKESISYFGTVGSGNTLSITAYGMDNNTDIPVTTHIFCNFSE